MTPILDPGTAVPESVLEQMRLDLREEIAELLGRLPSVVPRTGESFSLRTAIDLGGDLVSMIDLTGPSEARRELRIRVLNTAYDGQLAMIDLLKSHSALPKVPRGPSAPAALASGGGA
jgi:hypothetical protein